MNELTAAPCEAEVLPARVASGLVADARGFLAGMLFTSVLTLVGTFLVAAALLVGVVGSPLIAATVAWVVIRHRRAERTGAWSPWTAAR
jgi:hypothetical protein